MMHIRHSRATFAVLLIVAVFPALFCRSAADAQEITAEKVRRAIRDGADYLLRRQNGDGSWKDFDLQNKGGVTSLVTLALLNCGVTPENEPRLDRTFNYLDSLEVNSLSTYTVSLLTMVYATYEPDRYAARIRECVECLTARQLEDGGWSYMGTGRGDGSNTQFALLALHEARLAGIEVPRDVWTASNTYWNALRTPTDAYLYSRRALAAPSGSMTCAAIAALVIIDENLKGDDLVDPAGNVQCCGDADWLVQVDRASDWLGNHFSVRFNPTEDVTRAPFRHANLYYLYALERAGRLTGRRFFGEHDWYREGADYLWNIRQGAGYWVGGDPDRQIGASHGEKMEEIATSFALLFLAKGRRPVVVGKYRHSDDNDWDRHRKGVHFLTRRLEKEWQIKLNWQSIDGRVASTNDLLKTPVLFLSGRDSLDLSEEQKTRLKKYVEYGRFIFAEACQGDGCTPEGQQCEFARQFEELMVELFPDNELKPLPPTHPIWSSQHKLKPDPERPLLGIQTSCRTAVVYVPANLSCFWQANQPGVRDRLNGEAQQEVDYCLRLASNVIAYATGRELRDRLDSPEVVDTGSSGAVGRRLVIPKLAHRGGADDAPNAWQNVLRRASVDTQQPFRTESILIEPTPRSLARHPMVFMHGRHEFEFTEVEREALRDYLNQDGFLFADSICASAEFAGAFQDEMKRIFVNQAIRLERLPRDHPIFTDRYGGYNLSTVEIRRLAAGELTTRDAAPHLEGLRVDGRLAVVFSPYDLSCAMENAASSTCEGYSKEDASKIAVNVLLYVLNQ